MTLLNPAEDARPANWVVEGMHDGDAVDWLLPGEFPARIRVFHPAFLLDGAERSVCWSEVGAAIGTEMAPGIEFFQLLGIEFTYNLRSHPGLFDRPPSVGSLPVELFGPLVKVLRRHTEAPDRCWFGFWEGWGDLRKDIRATQSTFELPFQRRNHLLYGPLEGALESAIEHGHQSPSIWWPNDHAWCVATEIDFDTTYLGCSAACRDEILACPDLETLPIDPAPGRDRPGDPSNLRR